jgi:hypothetical protein
MEDDKPIKNNNNASVVQTNVIKTSRKRSLPTVKNLGNVKRNYSPHDVKENDEVESFDDSDSDIKYSISKSQLSKSKIMRRSFRPREETPVKTLCVIFDT